MAGVNLAVLRKALQLHDRGMVTRAEIEREFGKPYRYLVALADRP